MSTATNIRFRPSQYVHPDPSRPLYDGAADRIPVLLGADHPDSAWVAVPTPVPPAGVAVLDQHGFHLDRGVYVAYEVADLVAFFNEFAYALGDLTVDLVDDLPREPESLAGENRIGEPIPLGKHSDVIEDYARALLETGLSPDRAVLLTDIRGQDCTPRPWSSCTNAPCAHDAARRRYHGIGLFGATCAELRSASPHRMRAGASMVHDGVIPGGAS